jgi:hypothetical protein
MRGSKGWALLHASTCPLSYILSPGETLRSGLSGPALHLHSIDQLMIAFLSAT